MVHGFFLQSLLPGSCHVLYSRVYGEQAPQVGPQCEDPWTELSAQRGPEPRPLITDLRRSRKDKISKIAERVQSEYAFKSSLSGRSYEADLQNLSNEGKLPDMEIGFFSIPPEDGNPSDEIAVWMGAMNSGFVLVCDKHENTLLAETVLKLLIKYLQEHCRVFIQQADVMLKADRVSIVLEQFLPGGRLLFMNHRVIRQFEKELESKMK